MTEHTHEAHSHLGHLHAGHSHDHAAMIPDHLDRSFIIGIILNVAMVVVGAPAGFYFHSLALLSDAGHNLSDVASLLMALGSIRLAKVKATPLFTYGYKKSTILTSLLNAVILVVVTGFIIYEAFNRLRQGSLPVQGPVISAVAFVGIIFNSVSAWLFLKDKENDINVKGAYLHLAADALVSAGVLVAGIVMYFTSWFWLDPVISILISIVVLASSWRLLTASIRLSLDGVPENIDLTNVAGVLSKIEGIQSTHHLHVWALSTTENALTAHVVMDPDLTLAHAEIIKASARHALEHLNIKHVTLEVECAGIPCEEPNCD